MSRLDELLDTRKAANELNGAIDAIRFLVKTQSLVDGILSQSEDDVLRRYVKFYMLHKQYPENKIQETLGNL